MSEQYDGPERRHGPDFSVALARLEAKMDALVDAVSAAARRTDALIADLENRLRAQENVRHDLLTRSEYEKHEAAREARANERQRRTVAWFGIALALGVPVLIYVAGVIERQL